MNRGNIQAEFDRFIEFPDGSPRTMVTVTSTLLFAEHVARLAAAAEREACAKACVASELIGRPTVAELEAVNQCAAAIRARGKE